MVTLYTVAYITMRSNTHSRLKYTLNIEKIDGRRSMWTISTFLLLVFLLLVTSFTALLKF